MVLPPAETDRFFRLWFALLHYVNARRRLVAPFPPTWGEAPLRAEDAYELRNALWAGDALRERFVADNPARLPPGDLELVESWRHRLEGVFFMSVVSAGEVYYQLVRAVGPASAGAVWGDLTRGTMPLVLAAATTPRVKRAAAIKARYPLAYADAFAVGLAAELGWPLATGDPEMRRPAAYGVVRVEWLGHGASAS
jgi:hypothetical protein